MIPNIVRGGRMVGLVMYLAGEGQANEHQNQRLITGDDRVLFEVEPGVQLSADQRLDIANILERPNKLYDTSVTVPAKEYDPETGESQTVGRKDAHVWHCSLSLRAEEGQLDDATWAKISRDFVEQMGFIDPDGAKSSRWAVFHHGASKNGNDHVHIAVQLVREDGTKADVHNDQHRAHQVCAQLERKYGLEVLETREQGRGLSGEKPAERRRAETEQRPQGIRDELRRRMRSSLATASHQGEYIQHLLDAGVRVQPRFKKGSTSKVAGYRVAMPPRSGKDGQADGQTVWYSPSKLDAELSWPKVGERFAGRGREDAERLLASLHQGKRAQPDTGSRLPGFSRETAAQLMSGKTTPDSLANIYARVSMSLEARNPGEFTKLSQDFSRLSQGPGNSRHAVQLMGRAASKDSARGWIAMMKQANRLARVIAETSAARARPQWSQSAQAVLASAEAIVEREAKRQATQPATAGGTASRGRGPGQGGPVASPGHRTQTGRETATGYGR